MDARACAGSLARCGGMQDDAESCSRVREGFALSV